MRKGRMGNQEDEKKSDNTLNKGLKIVIKLLHIFIK